MKNYVTAEFETVDLADIASHKIKYLPGVSAIQSVCNPFATNKGKYNKSFFTTPIIPFINGVSNAPIFSYPPLYDIPSDYGFSTEGNWSYEPSQRVETLLKVEIDGVDGTNVSTLLRNAGGRHIKVVIS